MVHKSMILLTVFALTALAFGAPNAAAIEEPNIGCGGEVVEVCVPICVQGPCYPFVCVHVRNTDVCVAP